MALLTVAPSFGEVSVTFGAAWSKTYVTTADGGVSPAGPTSVAVKSFWPAASLTLGITIRGIAPTEASAIRLGALPGSVT